MKPYKHTEGIALLDACGLEESDLGVINDAITSWYEDPETSYVSEMVEKIERLITDNPKARRMLILDYCFATQTVNNLSETIEQLAVETLPDIPDTLVN